MIDRKMNNKAEEIKELLALYYEGKTTKSQEDMLCEYFASNSVPEELSIDKEIFCALTSSRMILRIKSFFCSSFCALLLECSLIGHCS